MTRINTQLSSRSLSWICVVIALTAGSPCLAAQQATYAERMHARAVDSFRQGGFPEAHGRFVELANTGPSASARYVLWMCEQGPALFGTKWECAPREAEESSLVR